MSMYMCKAHGGYAFVADCVECKAISAAASLGSGEFTTEGVKRVADKMRDDGQPILASALMDLAGQRDTLRAQLEEQEARVGEAESLLIALIDQFGRRCDGERRIDAPGHSHSEPGIWDSDNGELAGKLCDKCALWRKACAAADAALSQPGKGE